MMGAFQVRIALPVRVRRELERSQIFLSLDPMASGILRVTIVPEEERISLANQANAPAVFWLHGAAAPGESQTPGPDGPGDAAPPG
jgi:hypothetical protein